jgi:hypothetical protein
MTATDHHPPSWPDGVNTMSLDALDRLGIHKDSNKLYWDGKEVVTKRSVALGGFERFLVAMAGAGTFGTFMMEAGRSLGFWP